MTTSKVSAIITAGGTGSRFGVTNKLLEKVCGKEIICHTVEAFLGSNVDEIVICANEDIIPDLEKILSILASSRLSIIKGGATRQESVYNGLKACEGADYVLIHDGARPVITPELINEAIKKSIETRAMTVATKTIDTIKEVENGIIIRTIDRTKLYNIQTPQGFEYNLIKKAHEKFVGESFTDDAGMVEALGETVHILEGGYKNIKVTTPDDIAIAEVYLQASRGRSESSER